MTDIETLRELQTQLEIVSGLVRSQLRVLEGLPVKASKAKTARTTRESVPSDSVFPDDCYKFSAPQAHAASDRRERVRTFLRKTKPVVEVSGTQQEREQRNVTLTKTCREQLKELSCEVGLKEQTLVTYFIRRIQYEDLTQGRFRGFLSYRAADPTEEKKDEKKMFSLLEPDDEALRQIASRIVKTSNVSEAMRQIVAFFHDNQHLI